MTHYKIWKSCHCAGCWSSRNQSSLVSNN